MAINFPSNPSNNQIYTYGNQTWYWANNYGLWQANTLAIGFTGSKGDIGYTGSQGIPGYIVGVNSLDQEISIDTPYLWYKFNEVAGSVINYGSYAPAGNLTLSGTYTQAFGPVYPSNTSANGILFSSTTAGAASSSLMGLSAPITGDWTWETVLIPNLNGTNPIYVANIGATGETAPVNYQFIIRIQNTGQIAIFWEYGNGTDQLTSLDAWVVNGVPNHFVVVKDSTAKTLTVYLNGIKVATASYVNEPTGGTSTTFGIGYNPTTDGQSPNIRSHTVYYSGSKLSDARILAHAKAAGLYNAGVVYSSTVTGYAGSQGSIGYTGSVGFTGSIGFTGSVGYTGSVGFTGSIGYTGSVGFTGSTGAGYTGSVGFTGSGGTGFTGSIGYTGSRGLNGSGGAYTIANTAPPSPLDGDRWFNSDYGIELVYTSDGDSSQWVEISSHGFLGPVGYTGSRGTTDLPVYEKSTSYVIANGDNGSLLSTTSNVTINSDVVLTGFNCTIFNNTSANITIIANTGTTMYWAGTANTGNRTLLQRGLATIICVQYSNTFTISGNLF
jgi:Collagen triple helix repeat (20 copies)/Concanavalin A-like lectin/glucanases superfamily